MNDLPPCATIAPPPPPPPEEEVHNENDQSQFWNNHWMKISEVKNSDADVALYFVHVIHP